jgi:hypothetical protein
MDEIAKIQAAKDLLTVAAKEFTPPELTRQEQESEVVNAVLILLAANEMDRERAVSFLNDWVTNERESNYTIGMLHGYAIGEGFSKSEKRKLQHKTIAKIAKGLRKLEKRKPRYKAIAQITKDLAKLKKRKLDHKAKILQVLMKDPKATNMKIARALDNAGILLPERTSLSKDKRRWSEVVTMPSYKNLISRARKQVAKAARIRDWRERIDDIKVGAGLIRYGAGILDFDPPR